jgi:hypothetical protein
VQVRFRASVNLPDDIFQGVGFLSAAFVARIEGKTRQRIGVAVA